MDTKELIRKDLCNKLREDKDDGQDFDSIAIESIEPCGLIYRNCKKYVLYCVKLTVKYRRILSGHTFKYWEAEAVLNKRDNTCNFYWDYSWYGV